MFMYKELKKQKSESKLQIGILMAKLSESEAKLKEASTSIIRIPISSFDTSKSIFLQLF